MPTERCEKINESVKICKIDYVGNVPFCKIIIERHGFLPDSETKKFRCEQTGYLGYERYEAEKDAQEGREEW
jgi:hypothetical protein